MGLKIIWTEFAEKKLEEIFDYHLEKANHHIAKKLTDGIYNETIKLKKQPEIGQREELLKSRPHKFRYLVYKSYKIIYWVNNNKSRIEITDIFDTRQNPEKLKRME